MSANKPARLRTSFKEKIWGSTHLLPWYPDSDKKIGEVWFEADLPLLVKFIFTTEHLSVQVHPDDAYASVHEDSCGKTEMWHILRAEPGAKIALGLREALSPERLREASISGEIEHLLRWVDARPGQTFFTPAGTIHAIGAGIALCEIQQYSDVTYRLYDYGRPRELHLDHSIAVSCMDAHSGDPVSLPVDCKYFHTDLQVADRRFEYVPDAKRFHLLIFLEGAGTLAGSPYRLGEAWLAPPAAEPFEMDPAAPTKFLRTWVP